MRKTHIAALAAAGLLTLAATVRALPPAGDKTAPSPAPAAAPLSDQSLLSMLEGLGYEPKVDRSSTGAALYRLTVAQDGRDYYMNLEVSTNKEFLWITASMSQIPEKGVPAEVLLKLLALNNEIGPAQVYYEESDRYVCLGLPLLNKGGITPAVLRANIGRMVDDIKKALPLTNFGETPAKPPA